MANAIGVGGLPGILSIKPQYMGIFAIAMAVVIVVPFALTYIIGRKKGIDKSAVENEKESNTEQSNTKVSNETKELKAYLSGNVISIEEVPDQVFSAKVLGDGLAIEPTSNILLAPADGEVSVVMDGSNHACGLTLANGMEILLHIGLDTVDMNGDGFRSFINMGDQVKAGDKLIEFDADKIKTAGHPTVTIMVVTDAGNTKDIKFNTGKTVRAGADSVASLSLQ